MNRPELRLEMVEGEPRAVRWVTTVDLPEGEVSRAPGGLGPLLEYGVLTRIVIEPDAILMWLAPGHSWPDHGSRIKDALLKGLRLEGWQVESGETNG